MCFGIFFVQLIHAHAGKKRAIYVGGAPQVITECLYISSLFHFVRVAPYSPAVSSGSRQATSRLAKRRPMTDFQITQAIVVLHL